MSHNTANAQTLDEQSPVMQARRKLGLALEALEANVMARLNEAEQLAASASASDSESAEQWQNACHMLEEQLTALKEENSQLHSELHQTREALHQAEERAADLKTANNEALQSLDDAIAQVEQILKA